MRQGPLQLGHQEQVSARRFPTICSRTWPPCAFSRHEKTYPSKKELEAKKRKAINLAQNLTRHMSDEDVAKWFDEQVEKSPGPRSLQTSRAMWTAPTRRPTKVVRQQAGLHARPVHGSWMIPSGSSATTATACPRCPTASSVLQPVADAYIKALVASGATGASSSALSAPRPTRPRWPNCARPALEPSRRPCADLRSRGRRPAPAASQPKSGADSNHSDHVDEADLAAQTTRNKEEAERQREVRRQAEAAAEARQPRALLGRRPVAQGGRPQVGGRGPSTRATRPRATWPARRPRRPRPGVAGRRGPPRGPSSSTACGSLSRSASATPSAASEHRACMCVCVCVCVSREFARLGFESTNAPLFIKKRGEPLARGPFTRTTCSRSYVRTNQVRICPP